MDWKEALTEIQEDGIRLGAGDYVGVDALKVAALALKKQIPQKPIDVVKGENGVISSASCPCCEFSFPDIGGVWEVYYECEQQNYCQECGQAIDWT